MNCTLMLVLVAVAVSAIVAFYVGYWIIFLYIFIADASRRPRRGEWMRRCFRPIAREVEKGRANWDPDALDVVDSNITRKIRPLLIRIGWGFGMILVIVGIGLYITCGHA